MSNRKEKPAPEAESETKIEDFSELGAPEPQAEVTIEKRTLGDGTLLETFH